MSGSAGSIAGERDVLVCGDEPDTRRLLASILGGDGFAVDTVADGRDAVDRLRGKEYLLVLAGVRTEGLPGLEVLREARRLRPATDVAMITGEGDVPLAIEAIRMGARDYLTKPFDPEDVRFLAGSVVAQRRRSRADAVAARWRASASLPRVTVDPAVEDGRPCLRGLPITVGEVLRLLAAGRTQASVLEIHPGLEPADLREALAWAAWTAGAEEPPPPRP
jgi:DNA-binding NtrC family response regulator